MYRVIIYENYADKTGVVIHEPGTSGNKLIKGDIHQELNMVDTFEFTMGIQNSYYRKVTPLANLVRVINVSNGHTEFYGRVSPFKTDMDSSGAFGQQVECENVLAYLHDSTQTYLKVQNTTIEAFFKKLISAHNSQVESWKQFKVGRVTVTNNTDNVYRYVGYADTFETIKDKLLDRLGGYLVVREEPDGMYIDYLKEYGEQKDSPIQIAKNLQSASREINVDELITRIVPVGAELEVEHEESGVEDVSRPRVTIESVNNGKIYISDPELEKVFGIIQRPVFFENVNYPNILKQKGEEYKRNQRVMLITWTVTAIELGLLDKRFAEFQVGNFHPIDNQFLSPVETLQIVSKKIDILNPQKCTLTIGTSKKTLSQYQLEKGASEEIINQLKLEKDIQKKRIESLTEEYDKLKEEDLPAQQQLIKDLENQIKQLQDQLNNLDPDEPVLPGKGTDISTYQTSIDWAKLKSTGHTFVMIRAGYGTTEDTKLATHIANAKANSFRIGLYLFSYATTTQEAIAEANFVCGLADRYGGITFPISFDWEEDSNRYATERGVIVTEQLVSDMALSFMTTVKGRGYKPMNYSNLDYYNNYFDDRVKAYDWWLARPGVSVPDKPCKIWQSELDVDGTSRGINGNADFDVCYVNYKSEIL